MLPSNITEAEQLTSSYIGHTQISKEAATERSFLSDPH
jgi:hypothetical protein